MLIKLVIWNNNHQSDETKWTSVEQKEELAQLAHVSESKSQGEESVARLPEKEEAHLPETGETVNIWTVYGLLTFLATSLWKVVYRRKEDQ